MMQVTVNGANRPTAAGTTMRTLLIEMGVPERGVAVAVDGALLPRSRWDEQVVAGTSVDVVTAVQGG